MTARFSKAPQPSFRLVPSRFPPIGLFDTVSTTADAGAVMELAGWTNDRLVAARVNRLPRDQWVYGRPNASVVMASFLHVAPGGMRFNGPDLGAWYASPEIETAATEVAHRLRREAVARNVQGLDHCRARGRGTSRVGCGVIGAAGTAAAQPLDTKELAHVQLLYAYLLRVPRDA